MFGNSGQRTYRACLRTIKIMDACRHPFFLLSSHCLLLAYPVVPSTDRLNDPSIHPSISPSCVFPHFLLSFLPSFLLSFVPSFFYFFLLSFNPPSLLLNFLPSFNPSIHPSLHPFIHPSIHPHTSPSSFFPPFLLSLLPSSMAHLCL